MRDVNTHITANVYSLYGFLITIIKSFHGIVCRQIFPVMVTFQLLGTIHTLLHVRAIKNFTRKSLADRPLLYPTKRIPTSSSFVKDFIKISEFILSIT